MYTGHIYHQMLHKRQEEMHGSQHENYGNPTSLSGVGQESHQEVSFNVKGSIIKNDKSESVSQDDLKMESGRSSTDISFNVQSVVENTSVDQDYLSKSSSEKLGLQRKKIKVQQMKFDFQGQVSENMAYANVMNKENDNTALEENSSGSIKPMDAEKQRKGSLTQIDEDDLEKQNRDISVVAEDEPQKQGKEIFLLMHDNNQDKQDKRDNVDTIHQNNHDKKAMNLVHEDSPDKHSLEEAEPPSNDYTSSREEGKMLDSFLESEFKYAPNTEVQNVEGKSGTSTANYHCTEENDHCAASVNAEVIEKNIVGIDTGHKETSIMKEELLQK